MSDPLQGRRRIPARVVSVTRIGPAPAQPRRVTAEPAPIPRLTRSRQYGAPLGTPNRGGRTPATTGHVDADFIGMLDDTAEDSTTLLGPDNESYADSSSTKGDDTENAPLIIWEKPQYPYEQFAAPRELVQSPVCTLSAVSEDEMFVAVESYLAMMVQGFSAFCCSPSVTESGNWQARIPMPDLLLPDTMLEVTISALYARLRFKTVSELSRRLLQQHVEKLEKQVKQALDGLREVEVCVW